MAHQHPVKDTDLHFVIDPVTRVVENNSGKIVIMQHDHQSEIFTFELPRYIDTHDMSLSNTVRVHYINIGTSSKYTPVSGVYEVNDLQVDATNENLVTFSWTLTNNTTQLEGTLNFIIRFSCLTGDTIDYSWSTAIYSGIIVAKTIDSSDYVMTAIPDILEQWKASLKGDPFTYEDFTPEQLEGLRGPAGIIISETEPTNEDHPVWLNPDGEAGDSKPFVVTVTYGADDTLTADKTHAEIVAAYAAGAQINAKIVNYPGVMVPSILPLYVNNSDEMFMFSGSGVLDGSAMAMTATDTNGSWRVELAELAKLTDIPTSLKNPESLTFTGAVTGSYDGSQAVTVEIPSGKDGADGYTPVKGVDYWTASDQEEINADNIAYISTELAKRNQLVPEFANSVDECTDTTKLYVLPDGYIYAYMTKSVTHTPTNQVPNSKAADGTPYNGGQGYKDNTRLSLSAGESSQNGYTVTGFIPVKVGDTIRFKNVNTSSSSTNVFIIFYNSSHNYVGYLRNAQATEILSAGICVLDDTLTLTSGTLDGTAFFRVSMKTNNQADYFFTINELTEPTIVTEDGWFSTGHAFVPADYEDRIIGLEARVDDIADDTNNAPTYITNEAKRVADVVKGKQTVGSLTFTAMSDFHVRQGNSYWADNVTSCRDAGLGLAELQKHLRLDFSALLGDYTVGGASDTVEKVKQDISIVKTFMSKGQKGISNLWLTGNHDINYGASSDRRMTEDEMFAYITNNNNCTVQDFDNIGRNYGYIDFDNQKIRCIYLNTVDSLDYPDNVGSADDNSEVTAIQTQWLADVGLNLTAKSDAAEWGIVLFSHHCLSIFPHATTIVTAYRNGESGSVNVTTNGVTTAVDYDFTTANRGEIICAIHGHDHNFTYRKISTERWDQVTEANAWLWSICIPNVDTKRNNEKATNEDEAYRQAFGEFDSSGNPVYYPKTQGTATSTSFCVITIDRKNRKIHATAYGAGIDREISY